MTFKNIKSQIIQSGAKTGRIEIRPHLHQIAFYLATII